MRRSTVARRRQSPRRFDRLYRTTGREKWLRKIFKLWSGSPRRPLLSHRCLTFSHLRYPSLPSRSLFYSDPHARHAKRKSKSNRLSSHDSCLALPETSGSELSSSPSTTSSLKASGLRMEPWPTYFLFKSESNSARSSMSSARIACQPALSF
jgi:hypothetical protein